VKSLKIIGLWQGDGEDAEWPHPKDLRQDTEPDDKRKSRMAGGMAGSDQVNYQVSQ
jgi:hypothetical protein